eukprot:2881990-Amphidinium_carterae.2
MQLYLRHAYRVTHSSKLQFGKDLSRVFGSRSLESNKCPQVTQSTLKVSLTECTNRAPERPDSPQSIQGVQKGHLNEFSWKLVM